jgi:hypothetical protein
MGDVATTIPAGLGEKHGKIAPFPESYDAEYANVQIFGS